MAHNYNETNLLFNQNYLDNNTLSDNLYDWNTICNILHHNILHDDIYNKIQNRCKRFNNVINKYNKTTALFYMTRIVNCENIVNYMNKVINFKKKYFIEFFIIIIINCDNMENNFYYNKMDKCLFIIKNVENYTKQFSEHEIDNNFLNYEREFHVILNYFSFNLIEINNI